MGVFESAQAELNSAFAAEASIEGGITYHRGTKSVVITTAWIGTTPFRFEESGSSRLEYSERDYLIPVDSLILDSIKVKPQKGDYIIQVMPEPLGSQTYELSTPNDEPVWRYSDPQCTRYRVHCKRMVR